MFIIIQGIPDLYVSGDVYSLEQLEGLYKDSSTEDQISVTVYDMEDKEFYTVHLSHSGVMVVNAADDLSEIDKMLILRIFKLSEEKLVLLLTKKGLFGQSPFYELVKARVACKF